jgi:hypothetical protein
MVVFYNVETRTTNNLLTEAELTTLGVSDWNLVSVIQEGLSVIYIFSK